jgi:hypothetical protein
MKHFIIVLFSLLVICVTGQEKLHAYATRMGHWNNSSKEYTWEDPKLASINLTVTRDMIDIDDNNFSTYYCNEILLETEESMMFRATDHNQKKCLVMMQFPEDGEHSIGIDYGNYILVYFIE